MLSGYRLEFNKKSTEDLSGKANVTAWEGAELWGVLYAVSSADKKKLDKGEGGYKPVKPLVRLKDNSTIEDWVFVAKKRDDDPALRPFYMVQAISRGGCQRARSSSRLYRHPGEHRCRAGC